MEAVLFKPEDLMTTADIAAALGVEPKHACQRVVTREDFPSPVIKLSAKTRRWLRDDFMFWFKAQQIRAGKR